MASPGIVLCPAKLSQGECHEAHRQDVMVDGSCPKKLESLGAFSEAQLRFVNGRCSEDFAPIATKNIIQNPC